MKLPADLTNKLRPITEVYMEKGKYDIAIKDLLRIKETYTTHHIIDYHLGLCSVNTNDFEAGVSYLEAIKQSDQLSLVKLVQTNMILGLIFTELKEYKKAETLFKYAIGINPDSSMCHSALGYVYYLIKKYDGAIVNFRKAIQLDPNNASAHNNLGFTYAEINLNITEATVECRKAIALNPKSAAYRDSLGWVYFVAGQYNEAVVELQKALEINDRNPVILEHWNKAKDKRDKARKKK